MPRNLAPALIAFGQTLSKGALVLLPPPGKTADLSGGEMLRFQYNPETITRSRTGAWEARKNGKGAPAKRPSDGAAGTSDQDRTSAAFRGGALFSKSETIAMKLIFDATEMLIGPADAGRSAAEIELGLLPELGVLEQMAIAEPPKDDKAAKPKGGTKLSAATPKELLLVLNKRVFPVIITSMTISEKRFNPFLVPIRAEVDLQMQIMESTEVAGHPAIKAAYDKLLADRLANAKRASEALSGDLSNVEAISLALTQEPPKATGP